MRSFGINAVTLFAVTGTRRIKSVIASWCNGLNVRAEWESAICRRRLGETMQADAKLQSRHMEHDGFCSAR